MKVYLTEKIHPDAVAFLQAHGEVVQGEQTDPAYIIEHAAGCDAILIRSAVISEEIMAALPELKAVAKHGIGVDNIDIPAATARNILVLNAPFSNLNAVAEHAVMLIFAAAKNTVFMDRKLREGDFKIRSAKNNMELQGRTLGLLGFGRIARMVAAKAQGLGMKVIAYDAYPNPEAAKELNVRMVSVEELQKESDFISVHVPLLDSTKKMVNAAFLSGMKDSAVLVNTSRGPVVDEEALYQALKDGVIAGAGLDVFDPEPPMADNPLYALDNVTVSPHNAALTGEALLAMAMDSATGIVDYLEGRNPQFPVNREVLA